MQIPTRLRLALFFLLLNQPLLRADIVAISSRIFNGYTREQLPDGTFKPEFYAFGEGGAWTRPVADSGMDKLKFLDVARVAAVPLARMNFRPAPSAADTTLLILVFWGSTQGSRGADSSQSVERAATAISNYGQVKPADPTQPVDPNSPEGAAYDDALWQLSVANEQRDALDDRNARILGFGEAVDRARFIQSMSMGRDVLEEISDNRYYVVLQAYDFKTAVKEKKLKPLWTTRMSVREGGAFGPALEKMVTNGARYFGKDSNGLLRRREGTVDLAPMKVLDVVPGPSPGPEAPAKPPPSEPDRKKAR